MVKLEATLKDYNYCYVWSAIKLQFASMRFLSTYQMIYMIALQKVPWYLNYTLSDPNNGKAKTNTRLRLSRYQTTCCIY